MWGSEGVKEEWENEANKWNKMERKIVLIIGINWKKKNWNTAPIEEEEKIKSVS